MLEFKNFIILILILGQGTYEWADGRKYKGDW